MLTYLIPDFKYDRSTIVKGVFEYDSRSGELRRGELESSDNLTFIKSKEQLETKLRCIAGAIIKASLKVNPKGREKGKDNRCAGISIG